MRDSTKMFLASVVPPIVSVLILAVNYFRGDITAQSLLIGLSLLASVWPQATVTPRQQAGRAGLQAVATGRTRLDEAGLGHTPGRAERRRAGFAPPQKMATGNIHGFGLD